jgi:hypothetical protein
MGAEGIHLEADAACGAALPCAGFCSGFHGTEACTRMYHHHLPLDCSIDVL